MVLTRALPEEPYKHRVHSGRALRCHVLHAPGPLILLLHYWLPNRPAHPPPALGLGACWNSRADRGQYGEVGRTLTNSLLFARPVHRLEHLPHDLIAALGRDRTEPVGDLVAEVVGLVAYLKQRLLLIL